MRNKFTRWAKGSGCSDLATPQPVELHQFFDYLVEIVAEFLVGHPVDLPSDAPRIAVPTLVALTIQPTSVPGDMVDLDGPTNQWVCTIWMDRDSVWKVERMLSDQWADASQFQGVEHANLET